MQTEAATQALAILRNPVTFQWYVIPLFAFVVYVYCVEVERRNWSLVFAVTGAIFCVIVELLLNAAGALT